MAGTPTQPSWKKAKADAIEAQIAVLNEAVDALGHAHEIFEGRKEPFGYIQTALETCSMEAENLRREADRLTK